MIHARLELTCFPLHDFRTRGYRANAAELEFGVGHYAGPTLMSRAARNSKVEYPGSRCMAGWLTDCCSSGEHVRVIESHP